MSDDEYRDYPIPLPRSDCKRHVWIRMPTTITTEEWDFLANLFSVAKRSVLYDPPPPVSLIKRPREVVLSGVG